MSNWTVDQQQLDAVGVRIGLEVEFGAQNANADVARTNDEGFVGIFRHIGEYLAIDEDATLLAGKGRRIGNAAAGVEVQVRAVGKGQRGDFSVGYLLLEPLYFRLTGGVEQADCAQERNDEDCSDSLAPCGDTRAAGSRVSCFCGNAEPAGDLLEGGFGCRFVVDVQLVEKLFQLCFGIRIVSVLGEPHLHFELFLCGEFVFEIFV